MDIVIINWIIIPLLIFFARIIDVSIGTIRLIFISKGFKFIASALGFFEVIIWLIVIRQVMDNMNNMLCIIAYGAGFATGNYIGMLIEEKVSMGKVMIRVITNRDATNLKNALDKSRFNFTSMDAEGKNDFAKVFFATVRRKKVKEIVSIVHEHNPKAFYSIEDVRFANDEEPSGFFSLRSFKFPSINYRRIKMLHLKHLFTWKRK